MPVSPMDQLLRLSFPRAERPPVVVLWQMRDAFVPWLLKKNAAPQKDRQTLILTLRLKQMKSKLHYPVPSLYPQQIQRVTVRLMRPRRARVTPPPCHRRHRLNTPIRDVREMPKPSFKPPRPIPSPVAPMPFGLGNSVKENPLVTTPRTKP